MAQTIKELEQILNNTNIQINQLHDEAVKILGKIELLKEQEKEATIKPAA